MYRETALPRITAKRIRLLLVAFGSALLLILFRGAVAQLLYQTALAVLLAWAARPLCHLLERRLPAGAAALLSLLSFFSVLAVLLWLLVPQLISQITMAAEAVPGMIGSLQSWLERLEASPSFSRLRFGFSIPEDLLQRAGKAALNAMPSLMRWLAGLGEKLARAFLAPVLAFYFLRDRETFCFQLSLFLPLRVRRRYLTAFREMRREIAAYFRGQALVSLSVAALTAAGLMIVGVPAWLALGALMGICDMIPYMGPYLGIIPILLFSLPQGFYTVLWAVAVSVLVQQIESVFLSPRLMSGVTGLHPAYVLLLLSAGGLVAGLPGMLLSLPLFVCVRGAIRALHCAKMEEIP